MDQRQRYIELATIAKEVCELLEAKKIARHEGCVVRRIAEDMWNLTWVQNVPEVYGHGLVGTMETTARSI